MADPVVCPECGFGQWLRVRRWFMGTRECLWCGHCHKIVGARVHWWTIEPADAVDIVLPRPDIIGPYNEDGEPCPWPWEQQQLKGVPMGQYHCRYCGAMSVAGVPHPDYGPF